VIIAVRVVVRLFDLVVFVVNCVVVVPIVDVG